MTQSSNCCNGARVLVVDDTTVNRMILKTRLSQAGYEVIEAQGGGEALQLLRLPDEFGAARQNESDQFDVVVLDVMMPVIIRELMKVSTTGQLNLQGSSVNVLLEGVLEDTRAAAEQAKVMVRCEFDKTLPDVSLAKIELAQTFTSIVQNAIDAMPEGGTLSVRTRHWQAGPLRSDEGSRSGKGLRSGADAVEIAFFDTGTGIREDELSKLYDPFFTTRPVGSGTGLGLSVVRKVVELHGGSISIENRSDENGVQAVLLLPLASSAKLLV